MSYVDFLLQEIAEKFREECNEEKQTDSTIQLLFFKCLSHTNSEVNQEINLVFVHIKIIQLLLQ